MLEDKRLFTLTNAGEARNCSLTSVFTPNLKLIQFQIGPPPMTTGLLSPVSASHKSPTSTNFSENIHWCVKTHINFSFTIHCILLPLLRDSLFSNFFQCFGTDYVDIGGTSTLDPTNMEVKENICGREPEPAKKVMSPKGSFFMLTYMKI